MNDSDRPIQAEVESKPAPRRRRAWIEALILGPLFLVVAVLTWLASTQSGLTALAQLAERLSDGRLALTVGGGTLLGPLRLSELRYSDATTRIALRDVGIAWTPAALAEGRLELSALSAVSLDVATTPSAEPMRLPQSLALPIDLRIDRLAVGSLKVGRMAKAGDVPLAELHRVEAKLTAEGGRFRIAGLRFDSAYGVLEGEGSVAAARPFALDASARLAGARDGKAYVVHASAQGMLEAFNLALDAEGIDLKGRATVAVAPFAAVPLKRVQAEVGEIDPAAWRAGAPHAALTVSADLRPAAPPQGNTPLPVQDWVLTGPIEIVNRNPGPIDRQRVPVRTLKGRAQWQASRLAVDDIELSLAQQGRAAGKLAWEKNVLSAHFEISEVSLHALASGLKPTRLAGRLAATVTEAEQRIEANLREPRFVARFEAIHRQDTLQVKTAHIEAKGAGLDIGGRLGLAGRQAFEVRGKLARFDPSLFAEIPKALLNADFAAHGELKPLAANVEFSLRDSRLQGKPLAGQGRVRLLPDRLAQGDVSLDLAGNRVAAQGAFGRSGDRLNMAIDAPRLGALGYGFAGVLKGDVVLSGTLAQPSARFDLAASELALPGKQTVSSANAKGELLEGSDGRFSARIEVRDYRTPGFKEGLVQTATLEAEGTRRSHVLRLSGQLAGNHHVVIEAAGALKPGPTWAGTLRRLDVTGKPALALAAPTQLEIGPERITLASAELHSGTLRAHLNETEWTPGAIVSRGQVTGLSLGLGFDAEQRPVLTDQGVRLGGEWQLRLAEHADGMARLYREAGDLTLGGDAPVSLGLTRFELRANAVADRLAWSVDAAGARLGEVSGAGTALVERAGGTWRLAPHAPVAGAVRAVMPSVAWLGPWLDPNLRLGGMLRAEFAITGSGADPRGQGSIRGERLTVSLVDQGTRLNEGELRVAFDRERVRLESLSFAAPHLIRPRENRIDYAALTSRPGRLSATGEFELASGRGRLQVEADRLTVVQRPDRWLMVSGDGKFESGPDGMNLSGKVQADAGYWELSKEPAPGLSDDVVVKGRSPGGARRLPLSLDVEANLGNRFYFKGRGLDSRLAGALRLRGDGHRPLTALGLIRTRGGSFDAYGRNLAIERGIVTFQGPLDNAGLNVLALRKNLPVEAGVSITGTVQNPQVKLVSEPNVPDAEKLSWIVLGRGQDQGGGADSALLLSAAGAIFGGQSGGIPQQLANGLGLDTISVGSGEAGGGASALPTSTVAGSRSPGNDANLTGQIVTVGKRLSSQAYLSFERSLTGAESVVKITYNLTRRLSLIGRAGTDNAVDLLYTFSFQ